MLASGFGQINPMWGVYVFPGRPENDPRRGFYTLLLQLLTYGTIIAVERQTCCGTAPACQCRESMTPPYGALGNTAYSRDETAKSHPLKSNTLHLVPIELLVATHPVAVGTEWCRHVWDLLLPFLHINRQAPLW